jgi:hypothetical protein
VDRSVSRLIRLAAVFSAISSALCGWLWFGGLPFDTDTASYLFQAMLFARGELSVPAPSDPGLVPSSSFNFVHGLWYAKSAWGNALALVPGAIAGVPWIVPAVETGLALIIVCRFVERAYGRDTAVMTAALLLISPAMVAIGATWASEATSRLALALYLLGLIDVARAWDVHEPPSMTSAILLGGGLGWALCTRPLTAAVFALPGAAFCTWMIVVARPPWRDVLTSIARAAAVLAVFAGSLLGYNAALTGHALVFTQSAEQPLDDIGFGARGGGYVVPAARPAIYTPRLAVSRTLRHTLPAVAYAALGWGDYRPELFNRSGAGVETFVGGLALQSAKTGDWIVLALRGASNGHGRVTLTTRHGLETQTVASLPLDTTDGTAALRFRMASTGAGYDAFVAAASGESWRRVGSAPGTVDGEVRVGPVASRVSPRDRVSVTYRRFTVADAASGMMSDALSGGLAPVWRWTREPYEWSASPSGVTMIADLHHSLHTDELRPDWVGDYANMLYQMPSAPRLDVAVDATADWRTGERRAWLLAVPLVVLPLLIGIGLLDRRSAVDWVLLACAALSIVAYACFYFDGSTMGRTPTHVRYHNEATILALLPLAARGLTTIVRRVRGTGSRRVAIVLAATAVLLCANTARTFGLIGRDYSNWNDVYQQLPRAVRAANAHHAVVFLPNSHGAPLSDYPFTPLDRADVVYYRYGPFPEWRLSPRRWEDVYKQYFRGRRAFLYEHETLIELDPPRVGPDTSSSTKP